MEISSSNKRYRGEEEGQHHSGSGSGSGSGSVAHSGMQSFLASMTFAGTGADRQRGGCDCDECDGAMGILPQTIIDAIRNHKRYKFQTGPLKRTQMRQLIKRHPASQISIYQFTMPLDAEPLVEFGTSHRLLWIQRLSDSSTAASCSSSSLYSIGKGIVGSQDEERGRQQLQDWKQGQMFFVPSNGGKAMAWIHSASANKKESDGGEKENNKEEPKREEEEKKESAKEEEEEPKEESSAGHAILFICKIPQQCLNNNTSSKVDHEEEPTEWQDIIRDTCIDAINKFQNENTLADGIQYQRLSRTKAKQLQEVMSNL